MKNLFERINSRKVGKAEWIILALLFALPFLTECFYDIMATYAHGYALLKATLHGDFFQFHDYAREVIWDEAVDDVLMGMYGAAYSLPIYIIFGIWSIPVAIIRKIASVGLYDFGVILWYKTLAMLIAFGSVQKFYKILKKANLSKETIGTGCFLFASSLFFVMPVMFMGCYDGILVFFILWGIEKYLENPSGYKWIFVLAFAATFKMFALFLFIPLLLYKEKRILACLWKIILAFIPTLFFTLLFAGSETYRDTTSAFLPQFVERVLASTFPGGNSPIPIMIALWIALCIWAYMQNREQDYKELLKYVSWMGMATYSLIFLFVYCHPQWILILAPFIYLTMALNERNTKINSILELAGTLALSFFYILHFDLVYCSKNSMQFVLLKSLGLHKATSISLAKAFHNALDFTFDPVIFAVFAVAIVALIVINRPFGTKKTEADNETDQIYSQQDYGMIIIRILAIAVLWTVDLLINLDVMF